MSNWNEMYFFQVGLIILYDHVHPIGAFAKNSTIDVSLLFKSTSNNFYCTFKIFLRFWLAKIPLIHHNKLLSTKFGRILRFVKNDVNCAAKLPTEKTWGRGWDVLVVSTKRRNIWLVLQRRNERTIGLKYTKNSKKTTWLTPSAIWRIYAVLSNPLSPKLADKQVTEDELKIDRGKHVLACF